MSRFRQLLGCNPAEVAMIAAFHNQGDQAGRLVRRA